MQGKSLMKADYHRLNSGSLPIALLLVTMMAVQLNGCDRNLSRPPETAFSVKDEVLTSFNSQHMDALLRYLATHPQWDVCVE